MLLDEYFGCLHIIKNACYLIYESGKEAEEFFKVIEAFSPKQLDDILCRWDRIEESDGMSYILVPTDKKYIGKFNILKLHIKYVLAMSDNNDNVPVFEMVSYNNVASSVILDDISRSAVMFTTINYDNKIDYCGSSIYGIVHLTTTRKTSYSILTDIDNALKYVSDICDDKQLEILTPLLMAVKLKKSQGK